MNKDVDVLQQYKNISSKLKKRFLKKPNVAEGSEQFGLLAKQLKSEECSQYAGFCSLAQARCEHTLSNWCAEAQALTEAARSFLEAEKDITCLNCPSFEEHLHAAINCYSHAIRVSLENKQNSLAAGLCLELGDSLKSLGKTEESIQHHHRAADLQIQIPSLCLHAMGCIASAKILTKDYEGALAMFSEMTSLAQKHADSSQVFFQNILCRCEISRILLLMLLQPTRQRILSEHAEILEKYSWQEATDDNAFIATSCVNEDLFLLLQSLVMACQSNDKEALESLQEDLWPVLSAEQNHLLHLVLITVLENYNTPLP